MVDQIIINPEKVRGIGNIIIPKNSSDFKKYLASITEDNVEIDGIDTSVYSLGYSAADLTIPTNIILTTSKNTVDFEENFTLTVYVENMLGNSLSDIAVTLLTPSGSELTGVTLSNGTVTFNYNYNYEDFEPFRINGEFIAYVTSDDTRSITDNIFVTCTGAKPHFDYVSIFSGTMEQNKTYLLCGTISNPYSTYSEPWDTNAVVNYYWDDVLVDSTTIDNNNQFDFGNISPPATIGEHVLKVEIPEMSDWESNSYEVTINVRAASVLDRLTLDIRQNGSSVNTITLGETVQLYVQAYNQYNEPYPGIDISFVDGNADTLETSGICSIGSGGHGVTNWTPDTDQTWIVYAYVGNITASDSLVVEAPALVADGIQITSTKDILSYVDHDSTTLTAQLMNNNSPVALGGKTVTFSVYKESDDTLVETLTDTTDNNGVASVDYYGKGTGDLYIKVECMSLQEIYETIKDIQYYNKGDNTNRWQVDTGVNFTTNGEYLTIQNTTSSEKHVKYPISLTGDWECSFEVVQSPLFTWELNNVSSYGNHGYSRLNGEYTNFTLSDIVGGVFKLEYRNGVLKTYFNDNVTASKSISNLTLINFGHYIGGNNTLYVKNIKIREL